MPTYKSLITGVIGIIAVCCLIGGCGTTQKQIADQPSSTVHTETVQDLQRTYFNSIHGVIIVNHTEEFGPGANTGSVEIKPHGQTPQEIEYHSGEISGMVFDAEVVDTEGNTLVKKAILLTAAGLIPFYLMIDDKDGRTSGEGYTNIKLKGEDGQEMAKSSVPVTIMPMEPVYPTEQIADLPHIAQSGEPFRITGTFDGDGSTTSVLMNKTKSEVLAENSASTYTRFPETKAGMMQVDVRDRDTLLASGNVRAVQIMLSAPEGTTIKKGQHKKVLCKVNGLKGLTEPITLNAINGNQVIADIYPEGPINISPEDPKPDGSHEIVFDVTGNMRGRWALTVAMQEDQAEKTFDALMRLIKRHEQELLKRDKERQKAKGNILLKADNVLKKAIEAENKAKKDEEDARRDGEEARRKGDIVGDTSAKKRREKAKRMRKAAEKARKKAEEVKKRADSDPEGAKKDLKEAEDDLNRLEEIAGARDRLQKTFSDKEIDELLGELEGLAGESVSGELPDKIFRVQADRKLRGKGVDLREQAGQNKLKETTRNLKDLFKSEGNVRK